MRPPVPATSARRRPPLLQRLAQRVVGVYMRAWHNLELVGVEHLPPSGPFLVLTNHTSVLDVPALMAKDPYPRVRLVVKASLFKFPVVRQVLQAYGAIPVDRDGRDLAGVRAIITTLREGDVVAIAAEGTRSRDGRLGPVHPVLARIAVAARVPLLPVALEGSYRALPPGARFPRREKITIHIGPPFTLKRGTDDAVAQQRIYDALAALLPADHLRPVPALASAQTHGEHRLPGTGSRNPAPFPPAGRG